MSIDQYGWPPMNGQSVKNWAPEVKHARKIFLLHKKTFLQIQTLELYQLFRVWRPTNMLRFFLLIFLLVLVFYQVYLGSWMICIFAWLSHWHCHCPGGGRAQGWAGWRREVFGRQILVLVLKILLFVLKILLFIKIVLFVFQVEMLFCNNHCSKRGRIGEPFFSHDSLEWTTAWKPKQAYSPMGPGEAGFPDQAHPPHIIIILVLPVIIIILALLQEKLVFQIKLILSPIKIIQLSWVMRRYSWIRSKVFFGELMSMIHGNLWKKQFPYFARHNFLKVFSSNEKLFQQQLIHKSTNLKDVCADFHFSFKISICGSSSI